ncbi:ubiquitin-conjugating enzyme E2 G2 [Nematocida parisii]|uniref:Ubiquitin-conjugating enzyme E2 g n=1 Tax=Nematocida parisii (strain ERTm3) TaxID=935791 RepID=I3EKI2_NEMP3|nr:ubiquitin-conjugating enzyme E2 g [Nematocida parisii ERTm1]EIJ89729.1 ubiquitin-conjugating enzyme E2 g [Nematocida parisii ERTm3]KAI5129721.1 ubiquitin-conjugating enzyme E2 G2 [Nematocida parisii]KAI5166797.1 ubiquitin-conjugating enzyme E2 G2 [Nematocida sp. AWRm79]KAI5183792.1 ubiquitin-conjugating enzyme E2 G2 [Nematocida sp. AWRm78]EIJ94068.1 ubiquitin-conjugating enzyme E2 g [Nematocida parisii ERTm1]|eukprot:XP_013058564.1 ubiquitin-conjugating enzyme E2 g [Nematocida parisii ERTm1]
MAVFRTGPLRQQSVRRLAAEYMQLKNDPDTKWFEIDPEPEDFIPFSDSNIEYVRKWEITITGFKDTVYEGYSLKADIYFPSDYPLSPPRVMFTTKMYHPNIYNDGRVCISILHTAQSDPHSDELDTEQWTPVLSVRTILLSIMLLLNEPNPDSPANLDAALHFRRNRADYEEYVKTKILGVHYCE